MTNNYCKSSFNIDQIIVSRLTNYIHCLILINFTLVYANLFYINKYIANAHGCVQEEEKSLVMRICCSNGLRKFQHLNK